MEMAIIINFLGAINCGIILDILCFREHFHKSPYLYKLTDIVHGFQATYTHRHFIFPISYIEEAKIPDCCVFSQSPCSILTGLVNRVLRALFNEHVVFAWLVRGIYFISIDMYVPVIGLSSIVFTEPLECELCIVV